MERRGEQTIGAVLAQWLREQGLEQPFLEHKVVEKWNDVMGPLVARYTSGIEIKNGVLIVHIQSAALRNELFFNRFAVVKKMNEAVGGEVLRDVRFLG